MVLVFSKVVDLGINLMFLNICKKYYEIRVFNLRAEIQEK